MRIILLAVGFALLANSASAMSYRVAAIDDGRCSDRCPQAVVAEGTIQVDEVERLAAFFQGAGAIPATLLMHSPGGNLAGALKLGYGLRRLGVRTIVARVSRSDPAQVTTGVCASACVYALMGGADRIVPPGSRVIVHAAQRYGGFERDIVGGGYIDAGMDRGTVLELLSRYAVSMGVDPAVMSLAQSVPHESARVLSAAEISRFRLASVSAKRARRRR